MVNRFPYSNFHDLNADWIIEKIQQIGELDALQPGLHDVKYYGAVGDGVNDDTDAIRDCINNEDVIIFPPGTYLITSSITISGYRKRICGLPYAVIKGSSASITISSTGLIMKDLMFTHTGATKLVVTATAGSSRILNCSFEKLIFTGPESTIYGCEFSGSDDVGLQMTSSSGVNISLCKFISNGTHGLATTSCSYLTISQIECLSNGGSGIALTGGTSNCITNAVFFSSGGYGISNTNSSNLTIGCCSYSGNTDGTVYSSVQYKEFTLTTMPAT